MMLVLIALSRSADCMAYKEGRALELEETREDRVTGKTRKGRGRWKKGRCDKAEEEGRNGKRPGPIRIAITLHLNPSRHHIRRCRIALH